jgi:hypothetical protein
MKKGKTKHGHGYAKGHKVGSKDSSDENKAGNGHGYPQVHKNENKGSGGNTKGNSGSGFGLGQQGQLLSAFKENGY